MKRHRRTCAVWQNRDKKAIRESRRKKTSLERYGVEDASQIPEVQARRAATNRERFGADNPFSKEASTFDKVQASLEGKRIGLKGSDNPFARPEVQKKIRAYWQRNPQRASEIREQTKATNLERYGAEEPLSLPEVREHIKDTCEALYGGPAPSCDPEVMERARKTNRERYGVDWTCQDPDIRRRQLETMEENWDGHFFASAEGKAIVRAALTERYGVESPGAIDGHWEKAVTAFQARYGVAHPLQLKVFREKQRATNTRRYGSPFPGLRNRGPNLLERRVGRMCPSLIFTGDGAFWKLLPKLNHYKNPDFIVPGPDPAKPKKGVTKVVEVFGDFWHSRIFTGKAPFDHEQELIEAFREIGITCLIIWESEVRQNREGVSAKLSEFALEN